MTVARFNPVWAEGEFTKTGSLLIALLFNLVYSNIGIAGMQSMVHMMEQMYTYCIHITPHTCVSFGKVHGVFSIHSRPRARRESLFSSFL